MEAESYQFWIISGKMVLTEWSMAKFITTPVRQTIDGPLDLAPLSMIV